MGKMYVDQYTKTDNPFVILGQLIFKAKYTRRWKGPDGKWQYEYPKEKKSTSNKKDDIDSVKSISEKYSKHGIKIRLSDGIKSGFPHIGLDLVVIPKEMRGKGVFSDIMKDIIDLSNKTKSYITLTPDPSFGTSKSDLINIYKKFGFIENKGKNKMYEISETMYREPKG